MRLLVQSFGFSRTGYPEDRTGKGGGFVFDCRALDIFDYNIRANPDAQTAHFNRNGQDKEIIEAMDKNPIVQEFFNAVWSLVNIDIKKCLKHDIPLITANFGCTAGRHRSVYMAERLVRKVEEEFPGVEIHLIHLERASWFVKRA